MNFDEMLMNLHGYFINFDEICMDISSQFDGIIIGSVETSMTISSKRMKYLWIYPGNAHRLSFRFDEIVTDSSTKSIIVQSKCDGIFKNISSKRVEYP